MPRGKAMPSEKVLYKVARGTYKDTPEPIDGWELVRNTPTVDVWKQGKNILLGIRGTKKTDTRDIKADASLVVNGLPSSERYKEDKKVVNEIIAKYPPQSHEYYLVGHSLGGAIINQLKHEYPFMLDAVEFNPAFQPADFLRKSSRIKRYYTETDPLYKLGGKYLPNVSVIPNEKAVDNDLIDAVSGHVLSAFGSVFGGDYPGADSHGLIDGPKIGQAPGTTWSDYGLTTSRKKPFDTAIEYDGHWWVSVTPIQQDESVPIGTKRKGSDIGADVGVPAEQGAINRSREYEAIGKSSESSEATTRSRTVGEVFYRGMRWRPVTFTKEEQAQNQLLQDDISKTLASVKKRAELIQLGKEWNETMRARANSPFAKIVDGLVAVGDFLVDKVGSFVPGGIVTSEFYKVFAPPGSKYYSSASYGDKILKYAKDKTIGMTKTLIEDGANEIIDAIAKKSPVPVPDAVKNVVKQGAKKLINEGVDRSVKAVGGSKLEESVSDVKDKVNQIIALAKDVGPLTDAVKTQVADMILEWLHSDEAGFGDIFVKIRPFILPGAGNPPFQTMAQYFTLYDGRIATPNTRFLVTLGTLSAIENFVRKSRSRRSSRDEAEYILGNGKMRGSGRWKQELESIRLQLLGGLGSSMTNEDREIEQYIYDNAMDRLREYNTYANPERQVAKEQAIEWYVEDVENLARSIVEREVERERARRVPAIRPTVFVSPEGQQSVAIPEVESSTSEIPSGYAPVGEPERVVVGSRLRRSHAKTHRGKGDMKDLLSRLEDEIEKGSLGKKGWELFYEILPQVKAMHPEDMDLQMSDLDEMRSKAKGSQKKTLLRSALNTLARVIEKHHGRGGSKKWIQEVVARMKKGAFTKQALRHHETPEEYAVDVLKHPKEHTKVTRKRAQFLKNISGKGPEKASPLARQLGKKRAEEKELRSLAGEYNEAYDDYRRASSRAEKEDAKSILQDIKQEYDVKKLAMRERKEKVKSLAGLGKKRGGMDVTPSPFVPPPPGSPPRDRPPIVERPIRKRVREPEEPKPTLKDIRYKEVHGVFPEAYLKKREIYEEKKRQYEESPAPARVVPARPFQRLVLGSAKREPTVWVQALKVWNTNQPKWCVPRKGSKEHGEIVAIMDRLKSGVAPKVKAKKTVRVKV